MFFEEVELVRRAVALSRQFKTYEYEEPQTLINSTINMLVREDCTVRTMDEPEVVTKSEAFAYVEPGIINGIKYFLYYDLQMQTPFLKPTIRYVPIITKTVNNTYRIYNAIAEPSRRLAPNQRLLKMRRVGRRGNYEFHLSLERNQASIEQWMDATPLHPEEQQEIERFVVVALHGINCLDLDTIDYSVHRLAKVLSTVYNEVNK